MRLTDLYDSDTGDALVTEKEVDVSSLQTWADEAWLVYTTAKRGRIVQLQSGCLRVHYFYDEPGGAAMIDEDGARRGFPDMRNVVLGNAPKQ